MAHAKPFLVNQAVSLGGGAKRPVAIFGYAATKWPHILEHVAAGDQIAGAGESLHFDVVAKVEGEDRLEGLGPAARRGGFVKYLDATADQIRLVCHRPPDLDPVRGGNAIGIYEHQARGRGLL